MGDRILRKATFAGGCFWCMQPPFQEVEGVVSVVAGYTGGTKRHPTYEEVSSGTTGGHLEAVQVTYDPETVSYETLLDVFWTQIDPTDDAGQFADRGSQYRTAIFWHDSGQRQMAKRSKQALNDSGTFTQPVATRILSYSTFYPPAEEYHQHYAEKKPPREYQLYKTYSGREELVQRIWHAKNTVSLYSTPPRCHTCREIKAFLRKNEVAFEEIDITADDRARDMIIEKTGHIGAPPVVRIGNEFIFGFDQEKMERLLQKCVSRNAEFIQCTIHEDEEK